MSPTRRQFLAGLGASTAVFASAGPSAAFSGAINANSNGLRSGIEDDQGKKLQNILNIASFERKPVFIEPGTYRISNIKLPDFAHVSAVPGTTHLVYGGGDHFIFGENCSQVSLTGVNFDGALLPLKDYAEGTVTLAGIGDLSIERCRVINSAGSGIYAIQSAGRITNNHIEDIVGPAGFIGHNNTGISLTNNTFKNCANGGILAHRWSRGADNTIIANNRISGVSAVFGGTGQWGNGINAYLADGVLITGNHISDCAFSAIRSNSCSNVTMSGNQCYRSGETALYSEFAFDGAIISNNLVDSAATGISIANFNEGGRLTTCNGNLIRNIHDNVPYEDTAHVNGIGIAIEADTIATANVIENTKNIGMALGWGPYLRNVIASDNLIRTSKTGIAVSVVDGIGEVKIADNVFSRISDHAIAGYHWKNRVTGELAVDGNAPISSLSISGNRLS